MIFCGRYFHKSKETAIGTPMAVSQASCYMGLFETSLLQDYKNKFKKEPLSWLSLLMMHLQSGWDQDQNSTILSSFAIIMLVVKVTSTNKMYSFLNTKIELQSNGTLSTDLFCKSIASFQ